MSSVFDNYALTIGIECHIQLCTQSKLFSPARNRYGDQPNENVDVLDVGLPGTLPVVNERAVDFAIRLGLALGCQIRRRSVFSRKHYFYPDLPKGYQISQYDEPICEHGKLFIKTKAGEKVIRITRIHIEEDAGKNIHVEGGSSSFLDYNRAGTPLLEVVTEPDIASAEEAMETFKALRSLATYLEISDGNMEEGSLRADLNVSVRKKGAAQLGTRTETKNLNSIRFLGQAVEFEFRRQILELESGNSIVQETRLWDSGKKESRSLRSKEEAHDYRYFPEPDLLPLELSENRIELIQKTLPELPREKALRFTSNCGLNAYDADILTSEKEIADYFEKALALHNNPKGIANWIINDVLRVVKQGTSEGESSISSCPIKPQQVAEMVKLIDEGTISGKIAKDIFEELLKHPNQMPLSIVNEKGWRLEKDEGALLALVEQVLQENPGEVEKYRSGKNQVFGFLMGKVMQKTQGKHDPKEASELLKKKLSV